ncbi:acyl-CoA dehydratase activase [Dehalobacter sp. DCM]|uniref:acyl-CoA dehydratase activase n=1 Tax=Dehalobacter sp. DCM TaxID=2907827 RepID=UPI003081BD5D|nr:acyl-CoA dehydratase activase [Dehalobacter sp. DCM]
MLVAGVDVGAATAKTAIVLDGKLISWAVQPTGDYVEKAAMEVTQTALAKAGYTMNDIDQCCSTGYGRRAVYFSQKAISEIICHAKGVNYSYPNVRTIIDIGGQDSKVISVNSNGTVADFVMNDKCAAGTGRFLEVMADVMRLCIDQMGPEAKKSNKPALINSTCTIFAESEMVSLRAQKTPREDIIAGLHRAVSRRVGILGRQVGYKEDIAFTGGVALNTGIIHFLEEFLKTKLVIPNPPQIMGAIGAALLANSNVGTSNFDHEEKPVEDLNASAYV